ncbi:radical SAM protein [Candidatus Gracilibacteria bacterium]|nr:radical SAM protein [Candidatus Gracilibacteria bacterium]
MVDFSLLDKQIYFVKIIVGEGCPLRCSYCFVDKDNNRSIELPTLEKLIQLLMYTPGHNKLLHLLGGEPLIYFDIIKHGIEYARKLEKETGKQLDISFCTSGIGFTQERLDFIREHQIYLAWSIDGTKEMHDKNRKFFGGKSSYDSVIVHKDLIVSNIIDTHLGIAMTIDENTVENLYDSYIHLTVDLEFACTINIAPVDGKVWSTDMQKKWITELVKIHDHLLDEIGKGHFLYLNALNKEFRFHMISSKNKGRCLWFYTEAFTNGDILFNPFVNKERDYSVYVPANINDGDFIEKVNKYIGCKFDNDSTHCADCRLGYFHDSQETLQIVQMNKLLGYRDRITEQYASKIRLLAKANKKYQEYIDSAKTYMHV